MIAQGKTIETALLALCEKLNVGELIAKDNTVIFDGVTYQFRKGQQVAQGYINFSWVATAICIVTGAFLMFVTRGYVKILRERDEKEAAEKGIDLNAP